MKKIITVILNLVILFGCSVKRSSPSSSDLLKSSPAHGLSLTDVKNEDLVFHLYLNSADPEQKAVLDQYQIQAKSVVLVFNNAHQSLSFNSSTSTGLALGAGTGELGDVGRIAQDQIDNTLQTTKTRAPAPLPEKKIETTSQSKASEDRVEIGSTLAEGRRLPQPLPELSSTAQAAQDKSPLLAQGQTFTPGVFFIKGNRNVIQIIDEYTPDLTYITRRADFIPVRESGATVGSTPAGEAVLNIKDMVTYRGMNFKDAETRDMVAKGLLQKGLGSPATFQPALEKASYEELAGGRPVKIEWDLLKHQSNLRGSLDVGISTSKDPRVAQVFAVNRGDFANAEKEIPGLTDQNYHMYLEWLSSTGSLAPAGFTLFIANKRGDLVDLNNSGGHAGFSAEEEWVRVHQIPAEDIIGYIPYNNGIPDAFVSNKSYSGELKTE